ncbi:MAG: response regulator [Candidatus Electryonea clarkiae]|nr:response regulator [Candidatus Electryonea clarkiae]MDP8285261.1 response regulator [Candidatus Electryonea clarkiae]
MENTQKTILVVDDEQDIVDYLKMLFEDNGYKVLIAWDGAECEAMAREHQPDLITLDITMPKESGVKAYKNLRHDPELGKIPIILVTGYEDPNFEKFIHTRRTTIPPDGFFDKPIDREALIARVAELVG